MAKSTGSKNKKASNPAGQVEMKGKKAGKSQKADTQRTSQAANKSDNASKADVNGDDDDMAALKAHFLASFGEDSLVVPPSRADVKGKRKAEEDDGDSEAESAASSSSSSSGDEIDRLMANAKTTKTKGKESAPASSSSSSSSSLQRRPPPPTIVFGAEAGSDRGNHGDDLDARKNWRSFMKTQTANTQPEALTSATDWIRERTEMKKRQAAERAAKRREEGGDDDGETAEDEAEQLTNDRALSQLLNTTLFARGQSSRGGRGDGDKPDLSSHDTLSRILELSSSSTARKGQAFGRGYGDKALRAEQLSKMPAKMRQGIREAAGDRASKEVERNRELGLLNSKYSRKFMGQQVADATMTGRKAASKDRERGLSMGVGRFKNGTLHLSKDEVRKSLGEGRGGERGGGRGGGRGGSTARRGGGPNKKPRRD